MFSREGTGKRHTCVCIRVCTHACTYKYMCIYYIYTHFQVGRKFTSFANYDGKLLCRMICGLSSTVKKKSVWPYYHSIKKIFLDFPMLCFHLPSIKNPGASLQCHLLGLCHGIILLWFNFDAVNIPVISFHFQYQLKALDSENMSV